MGKFLQMMSQNDSKALVARASQINTQAMKGWNPNKWAADLQEAKTRLYTLGVELKIAQATYDEFFGDDEDVADGE